jgi:periplasmic protein TonB
MLVMKNLSVFLYLFFALHISFAQEAEPIKPDITASAANIEVLPAFPGGEEALQMYLAKNLRYPELAKEKNISGVVVLQFLIQTDGSIADVKVIKPLGGGCDEEALRVINLMPKWSPALSNGQEVDCIYTLPIRFVLVGSYNSKRKKR